MKDPDENLACKMICYSIVIWLAILCAIVILGFLHRGIFGAEY